MPDALLNQIQLKSSSIRFEEHDTAKKIKNELKSNYENYTKIVFIRSPYEKVVSSYFFLKNGKSLVRGNVWAYRKNFKSFIEALKICFNIFTTRVIPFKIWSLIRPVKHNSPYVKAKDRFIVNYIGLTEHLNDHLPQLLINAGVVKVPFKLPEKKVNTSAHLEASFYYKSGSLHKKIFDWIYRDEIQLYEKVAQKAPNFDFQGRAMSEL